MRPRLARGALQAVERRAALAQLAHQPVPLVFHLPLRDRDGAAFGLLEFRAVEGVAPGDGLGVDRHQIGIDGCARSAASAESLELRMVAIAERAAVQHMARKQRLAP